jgi:hypothetical protein
MPAKLIARLAERLGMALASRMECSGRVVAIGLTAPNLGQMLESQ